MRGASIRVSVGRRALLFASAALSSLHGSERQKTILFIRHGQSVANAAGPHKDGKDLRYYDAQLTTTGCAQASSWRREAPQWDVEVIMVSPLIRALQTASLIFEDTRTQMVLTPHAREGWWEEAENRGRLAAGLVTGTRHGREGEKILWPKLDQLPGLDDGLQRLEGLSQLEAPCERRWHPEQEAQLAQAEGGAEVLKAKWHRESLSGLLNELAHVDAQRVAVVCHYGVIASLLGIDAKNCDLVETRFSDLALLEWAECWRKSGGVPAHQMTSRVTAWTPAKY